MSKKKKKKNALKAKEKLKRKKAEKRFRLLQWISWGGVALLSLASIVLSLSWVSGEIYYVVTETYTFNTAESAQVSLAVLLPTSGNYQEVLEPEITWPGSWTTESVGSLEVVRFEADLAAGQTVEAVIRYQVNLYQGEAYWSADPADADDLSSSDTIQSDHSEIIAQAAQLIVGGDDQQTAYEVFTFTKQHLVSLDETPDAEDLSALDALQAGAGDSTAHTNLMTALSRAAELPARVVHGLVIPETIPFIPVSADWEHPADSRTWIEVYVDDEWLMADPSLSKQFYRRSLFGWTDGKHLVYGTTSQIEDAYESLTQEMDEIDTLIAEMSGPLYFAAWSDVSDESVTLTPSAALFKTWDARCLMALSIIVILVVINSLLERDRKRVRDRRRKK